MSSRRSRWARCGLLFSLALLCAGLVAAQGPPPGVDSEDLIDDLPGEAPVAESPLAGAAGSAGATAADAARAYAEGDLARALTIYRELGASHPEATERMRYRITVAWLLFEQGDRSAASLELRGILFENPALALKPELYSGDFVALFQNTQVEAAEARRRAAQQKLQAAIAAEKSGDLFAARRLALESLELQPLEPRAIYTLASLDLAEGKSDAALAGFEKVLALERSATHPLPTELKSASLNNVGVIYIRREQYEDAIQTLDKAVRLTPRDARSWFNLGLARLALDRKVDGLDALRRAHELDRRDADISLRLARAYAEIETWVEPVAVLLEATSFHPENALLWLELGRCQRGLGNGDGANTSLRRAIELDPAGTKGVAVPATLLLARNAIEIQKFALAAEDAALATRLEPGNATAWAIQGRALQGGGDLVGAARSLERATELDPTRSEFAHNLGTVYLAQRRLAEAETAFQQALTLDPSASESAAAVARLQSARATGSSSARDSRSSRSNSSSPTRPAAAPARELGARVESVDYAPLGIRGLLVREVTAGGIAARAGLLADDLILRGDGQPLTQLPTLVAQLRNPQARSLALSILRAGKPVEVVLKLD